MYTVVDKRIIDPPPHAITPVVLQERVHSREPRPRKQRQAGQHSTHPLARLAPRTSVSPLRSDVPHIVCCYPETFVDSPGRLPQPIGTRYRGLRNFSPRSLPVPPQLLKAQAWYSHLRWHTLRHSPIVAANSAVAAVAATPCRATNTAAWRQQLMMRRHGCVPSCCCAVDTRGHCAAIRPNLTPASLSHTLPAWPLLVLPALQTLDLLDDFDVVEYGEFKYTKFAPPEIQCGTVCDSPHLQLPCSTSPPPTLPPAGPPCSLSGR